MQREQLKEQGLSRALKQFEQGRYFAARAILLNLLANGCPKGEKGASLLEQLALVEMRCHNYTAAINYLLRALQLKGAPLQAAWRLTLLGGLYRQLGLKRERFQVDCRRLLALRKMAFSDPEVQNRIYALSELIQELEDRDLSEEAAKYEKMLSHYRDEMSA